MSTPRIRIVIRHKRFEAAARRIEREAQERGIKVSDKSYDIAVAVGGDGTIINTAVECKPVMAVKGGSRNHLIDIPLARVGEAFDMLLKGKFREDRYTMLEVAHKKKKTLAFNEVGITSVVPLPIGFSISYLDTEFEVYGDGVLVSTPQGSTGWSFSSNGSYLSPKSRIFLISLLNPVMVPLKSVVIPEVPIRLTVDTKDHRDRATLVSDGNMLARLDDGAEVNIRKSGKQAIIYRFFDYDGMGSILGEKGD